MSDNEVAKEGFFQINDIKLTIPPSQIQISKMNHANKIANLRTSSEATIWSRNKETHVNIKLFFTDKPRADGNSGFTDLKDIIAGLRVTPFCYIENEFIRNSILGAGRHKTMMFAVRSINVSTANNAQTNSYMPGTISVEMDLSHFNYNPYVSEFKYQLAPFSSIVKDDPSESGSWKIMTFAEKRKRNYVDTPTFTDETRPAHLTILELNEFKMVDLISLTQKIKQREEAYQANLPEVEVGERDYMGERYDPRYTSDQSEGVSMVCSADTTMISPEVKEGEEATIEEILMTEDLNKHGKWKLYKMRDGTLYSVKKNPFKGAKSENIKDVKNDDLFLFTRLLSLSLSHSGLHILGININFSNRVTPISLIGSETPTFQYLGGSDASVSMSLKTTNKSALKGIISLERLWQSQTNRMRVLPLKLRRIKITNDFLNMCGLHHFLLNNLSISTSPGEPDCRYIHLDFSEKEFDGSDESFAYETFRLHPNNEILKGIIPLFNKNLIFLKGQFSKNVFTNRVSYKWRTRRKGGQGYIGRQIRGGGRIGTKGHEYNVEGRQTMGSFATGYSSFGVMVPLFATGEYGNGVKNSKIFTQEEVYDRIYAPSISHRDGITKQIYKELLNHYSIILSDFVVGLVDYLQVTEGSLSVVSDANLSFAEQGSGAGRVFSHKNNFDLQEIFSNYYNIFKEGGNPFSSKQRIKLSIDWEYKRWKFINELKENRLPGIVKAREDAFSILKDDEITPRGANYYKNILLGKVNERALDPLDFGIKLSNPEYEQINTEYDEDVMWKDLKSQQFFIDFIGKRSRFFRNLVNNKDYLRILSEVFPSIKEITDKIDQNSVNGGSNAYPDFPMEEVVDLIGAGYKDSLMELQRRIKELNKGLAGKFLSISRLFGPDFYVSDPVESLDTILGIDKLKTAAALVSQSAASKPGVLNDWFRKIYRKNIGERSWEEGIKNRLDLGKEEIQNAFKTELIGDEAVSRYYDDETYECYLPPDYYGNQISGLDKYSVNHIASSGETEMEAGASSAFSTNPRDILGFEANDGLTKEEKKAYAFPNFAWPITGRYTITSKYGKRKDHGGTDHNGIDIISGSSNEDNTSDQSIRAAADGVIKIMKPKSSWERNLGTASVNPAKGFQFYRRTFTWKDYFEKETKLNLDKIEDLEKFKKDKGYGDNLWDSISGRIYTPLHEIQIEHKGGWKTEYKHIANDADWKDLYRRFIAAGTGGLPVRQGDKIGNIGNTGISTSRHLHFGVSYRGEYEDPQQVLNNKPKINYKPKADITGSKSVLKDTFDKFESSLKDSRGMIKAYPTFKLYFIESDAEQNRLFGFDDFFAYQAIQEIQVVRNADNPVDLCIVRLTNLSGNLTNKKFIDLKQNIGSPDLMKNKDKPSISSPVAGEKRATESIDQVAAGNVDTKSENPITSLLLKSGTQIQLRMGYSPNPDDLPIVFNGVVMDIEYHGTDEMITITCQSYGLELASNLQGVSSESNAGSFSVEKKTNWEAGKEAKTGRIVETLMSYPELKHFGRWQRTNSTGFGYLADESEVDSLAPFDETEDGSSLVVDEWKLKKKIYGDNIYLPEKGMAGVAEGTAFVIYKSTIWDIIQELSYRHPGTIVYPVPYQGRMGPAMTLFFGLPDGTYVYRDPTSSEALSADKLRLIYGGSYNNQAAADRARDYILKLTDGSLDPNNLSGLEEASEVNFTEDRIFADDQTIGRDYIISKTLRKFATDQKIFKSFRNYHLLTDGHNIIENNIISSTYSTFNSATIEYSAGTALFGKGATLNRDQSKLEFSDAKTLTMKADPGIRDEEVREVYAGFPNCYGPEQAKRYGQSLLWKSMKQGYRGSIVILGDANIKPYDICYVLDSFTETVGPIEVEQVVHRFSHQSGFITEIVPRMCISTNEEASMATLDVIGLIAEDKGYTKNMAKVIDPDYGDSFLGNSLEDAQVLWGFGALYVAGIVLGTVGLGALTGVAVVGALAYIFLDNILLDPSEQGTGPLDAIGLFTGRKIITRTQMQHLFEYAPLSVRGRPLLGGLPLFRKSWGPGTFLEAYVAEGKEFYEEGREGYALLSSEESEKNEPRSHLDGF